MSVIKDVIGVLEKLPKPVIDAVGEIIKAIASSPEPKKDAERALVALQAKAAYRVAGAAAAKAAKKAKK